MSRYVINILASRDLKEIADYFTESSLEAGDRFFRAFDRYRFLHRELLEHFADKAGGIS
ncbi:hypothetical protein ACN4EG_05910 [Alkalinema pantanalense CENA528]|uniref:hypothetical protein n=1 Tax=Alkalinema pantanalense TaxID=1620705 RepID=UPI003D6E2F55